MKHSKEEIEFLSKQSVMREEALIKKHKQTHRIPSRGVILTPEIKKERELRKELFKEYFETKD